MTHLTQFFHASPWHRATVRLFCIFGLSLLFVLPPLASAHAAAGMVPSAPAGTCTTDPEYDLPAPDSGKGIISTIVTEIQDVLSDVTQNLFNNIVQSPGFKKAGRALITLYIAIYGILFTFGMVQVTIFDFAIRMVKIGIIAMLLTSAAPWSFFNNTVVHFFNDGTDDIIRTVTQIKVGGVNAPLDPSVNGYAPFAPLDKAIEEALSAKMGVTLMALTATGPYGIIFGLLLVASLGSFVKSMLTALWVYVMSLILKALLFGMAPLFLSFLLFQRTRQLFDGWLNQVVSASLQPIFLFIFFAFFVSLIQASIDNILATPVCWTEWSETLRGTPIAVHYWRFAVKNDSGEWEPYGGLWDFNGPNDPNAEKAPGGTPIFPIDLMTILIFLILAELTGRFNTIVVEIAKELAGATTSLGNMQGALSGWFKGGKDSLSKQLAGNNNVFGGKDGIHTPGQAAHGVVPGAGRNVQQAAQQAAVGTGVRPGGHSGP